MKNLSSILSHYLSLLSVLYNNKMVLYNHKTSYTKALCRGIRKVNTNCVLAKTSNDLINVVWRIIYILKRIPQPVFSFLPPLHRAFSVLNIKSSYTIKDITKSLRQAFQPMLFSLIATPRFLLMTPLLNTSFDTS